jgi:probable rRNA maturation factor
MTRRITRKTARRRRPRAASSIGVDVSGCTAAWAGQIRRAARAALGAEGVQAGHLDIAVVDERMMKRLHGRWMGKETATDVLTFDLERQIAKTPRRRRVEGQIVVCDSVARKNARESRGNWRDEVLLYVVHGCLHLCGYDDRTADDAARMHRREDSILAKLGRGAVYYKTKSEPLRRRSTSMNR